MANKLYIFIGDQAIEVATNNILFHSAWNMSISHSLSIYHSLSFSIHLDVLYQVDSLSQFIYREAKMADTDEHAENNNVVKSRNA